MVKEVIGEWFIPDNIPAFAMENWGRNKNSLNQDIMCCIWDRIADPTGETLSALEMYQLLYHYRIPQNSSVIL
jgi:hypothetical protein